MSASALAAVIKYAQNNDVSDLPISKRGYRRARDQAMESTPYGPMLIRASLKALPPYKNRDMYVVNPLAYLYTACKRSQSFFKLITETLAATPSQPSAPW